MPHLNVAGPCSPHGRRLARVAWIRRPARGGRPPAGLPNTTGYGCAGYQSPPSYDQHARRAHSGRAGAARRAWGWHPADSTRRACRCARRDVSACSGRSAEYSGRLCQVLGRLERENRIPEPATEPPSAGFGPCGARGVLGATAIVAQDPHRFKPSLKPLNTLLGRVMCRSPI